MIKMSKILLYLTFCVFLTDVSVESRHHHHKPSEKGRPGDESFEEYLKDAINKLKLDDMALTENEYKTDTPHLSNTVDQVTSKPSSPKVRSMPENDKYRGEKKGGVNRGNNEHRLNSNVGHFAKRGKEASWYKRLDMAHRLHSEHRTTLLPKVKNEALLNSLKPFIQREVIKDFALVHQIQAKLAKYNQENVDVTVGSDKPRHQKTIFVTHRSSISLSDGKNLLLFGIGVGSTVLVFILCVLGFHCYRCLRYKDGLFVKNVGQENTSTCKNNNSQPWDREFLTQGRKTDEFSSEEEIFNVTIPKSFHESLPNSPVIQRSSSTHSTPIKTRKPFLK